MFQVFCRFLIAAILSSLVSWQAAAQSSLLNLRTCADQTAAATLRDIFAELSEHPQPGHQAMQTVLCRQIDIGDIDGAVATFDRLTRSTGDQRNYDAVVTLPENLTRYRYFEEFLDRPETAGLPNREHLVQTARSVRLHELLRGQRAPFPAARELLDRWGQPDQAMGVVDGEETFLYPELSEAWAEYLANRFAAGDIEWAGGFLAGIKSTRLREKILDRILGGQQDREQFPADSRVLLEQLPNGPDRDRVQRARVRHYLQQGNPDASLQSLAQVTMWTGDPDEDVRLLVRQLVESGRSADAATVARRSLGLHRIRPQATAGDEHSGPDVAGYLYRAEMLLASAQFDAARQTLSECLEQLSPLDPQGDVHQMATAEIDDWIRAATVILVHLDPETLSEFELFSDHPSHRVYVSLHFLQQTHQQDLPMYQDLAWHRFVSTLDEVDDPDNRSAFAYELITPSWMELTDEQRWQLFEICRDGFYRIEILSHFATTDIHQGRTAKQYLVWTDQFQTLELGENDYPDIAWLELAQALVANQRLEEGMDCIARISDHDYLPQAAAAVFSGLVAQGNLGMVGQFVDDHPDINWLNVLDNLDDPVIQALRPVLREPTRAQLEGIETNQLYYYVRFADQMGLNLFDQEQLYSRSPSREHREYVGPAIRQAIDHLDTDRLASTIAALRLRWFREACQKHLDRRLMQGPLAAWRRHIANSRSAAEKLDRLEILFEKTADRDTGHEPRFSGFDTNW